MNTPNIDKRVEKLTDVVLSLKDTIIERKNDQNNDIEKLFVSHPISYYGGSNYEVNDHNHNRVAYYTKSSDGSYSGYDYSQNPLIGIYREFYPNGNIKTKGLVCWFGFNIGLWYYFNESGNVINTIDYDDGFDFSYEQVFKFCEENKISLQKNILEIEQKYGSKLLMETNIIGISNILLLKTLKLIIQKFQKVI